MQNILRQKAEGMKELLATWRHEFHRRPELGYEEFETTKKIVAHLTEMGYSNLRVGGHEITTGVMADIDTGRPGKKIALRADIDALPVTEEADVPYRSERPGFMHACGHDAHITMLLGAAKILIEHKAELNGSYRLIFQPAEEKGKPGGATRMIESGALDGVDAICGLHIWSPVPSGKIAYHEGPTMASAESCWIGWPRKRISPWRGGVTPQIDISVVLLPAPLAPIRVTISPSLMVSETFFSAWMLP